MTRLVEVNETYQSGYRYTLDKEPGIDFDPRFKPQLTPKQMLALGIFGGDYFDTMPSEFPAEWFDGVMLSNNGNADAKLNHFKVNASQPLSEWQKKGWIYLPLYLLRS